MAVPGGAHLFISDQPLFWRGERGGGRRGETHKRFKHKMYVNHTSCMAVSPFDLFEFFQINENADRAQKGVERIFFENSSITNPHLSIMSQPPSVTAKPFSKATYRPFFQTPLYSFHPSIPGQPKVRLIPSLSSSTLVSIRLLTILPSNIYMLFSGTEGTEQPCSWTARTYLRQEISLDASECRRE